MKGMIKGFKRTPHNVATKVGLSKKSVDPEFDESQRNFGSLETATDKLIKDAKVFIEAVINLFTAGSGVATHFEELFSPLAGEFDLIGKNPDAAFSIRNAEKLHAVQEELRTLIAPELELIESRIIGPVKELKEVLKSIRKSITKRDHKLMDYDRFNNSLTKLRDKKEKSLSDEKNLFKLEQDFEVATNEYENINNAMKVDLPQFMNLAAEFVNPLFNSFYYMQLNIFYLVLEKMNNFAEEAKFDIASGDLVDEYEKKRTDAFQIIENFNIIKRIISVSRLVQVARANNSGGGGGLTRSPSSMTTSSTSTATRSLSTRGPPPSAAAFKKPPPPPPPSSALSRNPPPPYSASNGATTAAATKRPPPPPPPLKPKPKPKPSVQHVVALYDFSAQAAGDLSFNTGDRIEIIERTTSTEDWWTGRLNGKKGVFPGNYVQDA